MPSSLYSRFSPRPPESACSVISPGVTRCGYVRSFAPGSVSFPQTNPLARPSLGHEPRRSAPYAPCLRSSPTAKSKEYAKSRPFFHRRRPPADKTTRMARRGMDRAPAEAAVTPRLPGGAWPSAKPYLASGTRTTAKGEADKGEGPVGEQGQGEGPVNLHPCERPSRGRLGLVPERSRIAKRRDCPAERVRQGRRALDGQAESAL